MFSKAANSAPDSALVERIRQRDRDAVATLYDRNAQMLFGMVNRIVCDDAIAKEVLQQTFVEAWRNVDSYDEARQSVPGWLSCLARICALEALRSRGLRAHADGGALDGIFEQLPPEDQRLIQLYYYQGLTNEEAARELAMPLETARTHLRTAISQLRKLCSDSTPLT